MKIPLRGWVVLILSQNLKLIYTFNEWVTTHELSAEWRKKAKLLIQKTGFHMLDIFESYFTLKNAFYKTSFVQQWTNSSHRYNLWRIWRKEAGTLLKSWISYMDYVLQERFSRNSTEGIGTTNSSWRSKKRGDTFLGSKN